MFSVRRNRNISVQNVGGLSENGLLSFAVVVVVACAVAAAAAAAIKTAWAVVAVDVAVVIDR